MVMILTPTAAIVISSMFALKLLAMLAVYAWTMIAMAIARVTCMRRQRTVLELVLQVELSLPVLFLDEVAVGVNKGTGR